MKAVEENERIVKNIHEADFEPFVMQSGESEGSFLQLNRSKPPGVGFHVYKMEAGCRTTPHEHSDDEEFLVISGEAVDNDGTVYREGDLILMKKGTQHSTYTEKGCIMAVYIATAEVAV